MICHEADQAFAAEFLLLSYDLNMGFSWVICTNLMTKPQNRRSTAAGCVNNTHRRERMHWINSASNTWFSGESHTYWSVWLVSEVYYVLPMLRLCHLGKIFQVNSRIMPLNRTNTVHGALCFLVDLIILIRK